MPSYTKAEYDRQVAKLARQVAAMLDEGIWPVRVKRSCLFGDAAQLAERLGVACVFYNYRHTEPEYAFTYTPEPVDESLADDGRVIFRVLRRGPIRAIGGPK